MGSKKKVRNQNKTRANKVVETATKKVEEPTKKVEEANKKVEEPTKKVEEPTKKVEEPTKNVEEPTKKVEEPTKKVEEPTKKVEEPSKKVEEPTKKVEEPSKKVEEPTKKVEEPTKKVEEPTKKVEEPTKKVEEPTKKVEEPTKKVEEPTKKVEEPTETQIMPCAIKLREIEGQPNKQIKDKNCTIPPSPIIIQSPIIKPSISLPIPTKLAVVKVPEVIKHPLENTWGFWLYTNENKKNWTENQKKLTMFDTVEDYWCLYHHMKMPSELKTGQDYAVFKSGISPMWEDHANEHGGRWFINLSERYGPDMDRIWLDVVLLMIGENFQNSDIICGAVVNVRQRRRVSIWTRNKDEAANMEIGRKLKNMLRLNLKLQFLDHVKSAEIFHI